MDKLISHRGIHNKDIKEKFFTIKHKDFKELILKSSFACSQDEARPLLKGCLLEIEDDENENIIGWEQSIKVGQRITVTSDVFRNGKLASRIIKFSYKDTLFPAKNNLFGKKPCKAGAKLFA